MREGFSWCGHCGGPHPLTLKICPVTARPLETKLHAVSAPGPHARIGTVIDKKYRIRAVLGEGGMGTVFEAEHLSLQRSVALKLIRPSTSDPKVAIKRMQHEARIAGAIGHPHICDVYDIGELPDGSPYLVMPRLVGQTLWEALSRQRKFPILAGVQMMIEILSGLHAAHQMKIVHRDLKPQNVFLVSRVGCDPLAKVLDFGLSKMARMGVADEGSEVTSLTAVGARVGTPFYMAPEQIFGGEVDARADLFSCGVVLYETLTGHRPFPGPDGTELVRQLIVCAPRPATRLRSDLPAAIDDVLARALARNPADRYDKATSFQDDLRALRDALTLRAAEIFSSAKMLAVPSLADSSDSISDDVPVGAIVAAAPTAPQADAFDDATTTDGKLDQASRAAPPRFPSDDDDEIMSTRFAPRAPAARPVERAKRPIPAPPVAPGKPPLRPQLRVHKKDDPSDPPSNG